MSHTVGPHFNRTHKHLSSYNEPANLAKNSHGSHIIVHRIRTTYNFRSQLKWPGVLLQVNKHARCTLSLQKPMQSCKLPHKCKVQNAFAQILLLTACIFMLYDFLLKQILALLDLFSSSTNHEDKICGCLYIYTAVRVGNTDDCVYRAE